MKSVRKWRFLQSAQEPRGQVLIITKILLSLLKSLSLLVNLQASSLLHDKWNLREQGYSTGDKHRTVEDKHMQTENRQNIDQLLTRLVCWLRLTLVPSLNTEVDCSFTWLWPSWAHWSMGLFHDDVTTRPQSCLCSCCWDWDSSVAFGQWTCQHCWTLDRHILWLGVRADWRR